MIEVLFEDNHLIAVNKPSGLLVQGDQTGDTPLSDLVKSYLVETYNKPGEAYLGVIHRIDRPTKGVVLLAKTSKALSRMNKAFAEHLPKKLYWAWVSGSLPAEHFRLEHWLIRKADSNKSFAYQKPVDGAKKAVLNARILQHSDNYHLIEIDLETGRHHQIRAQLAAIGAHIKGDLKYGAKRSNPDAGIDLLAKSIEFEHPVSKQKIKIVAPTPTSGIWKHTNL